MPKAFTKGQAVTFFQRWDSKGAVLYRHAIVHACGARYMTLIDAETGEMFGNRFMAALGEGYGGQHTFPRMTDEEARAKALELGTTHLARDMATIVNGLRHAQKNGWATTVAGHERSLRANLAAKPSTMSHAEAMARIYAKVGA